MKSHTDINQSMQLAEILPIESADMHFVMIDTSTKKYGVGFGHYIGVLPSVHCWSLAALLAQMPCVVLESSRDNHYRAYWQEMYSEWHESAVDACVELIMRKEEEK